MENSEKAIIKKNLGSTIKAIIDENKATDIPNTISSLRKLAANSGVEYAIIQKISSGNKDPQFTTLVSIADGLNISLSELIRRFEDFSIKPESKVNEKNKRGKKR